jgi:hypothetical protein
MDLRTHPGKHVEVNLGGLTVGGVFVESETWVPGVVVGTDAMGIYLTIELDEPYGGGEPHGIRKRPEAGQRRIAVELDRSRPVGDETGPAGIPDAIVQLAKDGKDMKFIKAYRGLNGATLDEAKAALHRLTH